MNSDGMHKCMCTLHTKRFSLSLFFLPQIGTFTTQHGEYFLEPLLNAAGEEYDEEHNKPHLVYRHERNSNISKTANNSEPCGASGNRLQTA